MTAIISLAYIYLQVGGWGLLFLLCFVLNEKLWFTLSIYDTSTCLFIINYDQLFILTYLLTSPLNDHWSLGLWAYRPEHYQGDRALPPSRQLRSCGCVRSTGLPTCPSILPAVIPQKTQGQDGRLDGHYTIYHIPYYMHYEHITSFPYIMCLVYRI